MWEVAGVTLRGGKVRWQGELRRASDTGIYAVPARFRRCATSSRLALQAATNLADGVKRHIPKNFRALYGEQAPHSALKFSVHG